jgi:hypothetical protein
MDVALTKFDAAAEQLDWAIKLYFDHRAYVPAITLAGAAEEILGELLGEASIFSVLRQSLASEFGLSPAVVSQQHLNRGKNWVKHWKDLRDDETTTIDLENDALQLIVRAMSNYLDHNLPPTPQGQRFVDWAIARRASAPQHEA